MCVIFFYVNSKPGKNGYKLILASNRDEFYARDTLSAAKWSNTKANYVCGGIDLEPGREGGTWLALSEHEGTFKVGALLNLTGEPKARNNVGRGMIVTDYVNSIGNTIEDYNNDLVADCTKYNAFNFISIQIGAKTETARISLCSNVPPTLEQYSEGKCYGFGNSLPAVPFEKVRMGQQRFESIVTDFVHNQQQQSKRIDDNNDDFVKTNALQEMELIKHLQQLLKCEQKCWPDSELKRRAPNWGESLSALNVKMPAEGYGSRTHTIMLIDSKNRMQLVEETMTSLDAEGEWLVTKLEQQF